MSRDYQEYCNRCKRDTARKDNLNSYAFLYQCQECGMCWIEIITIRELKSFGKDEKSWKLAMKEAYEVIEGE